MIVLSDRQKKRIAQIMENLDHPGEIGKLMVKFEINCAMGRKVKEVVHSQWFEERIPE